jgi:hypothetical protein
VTGIKGVLACCTGSDWQPPTELTKTMQARNIKNTSAFENDPDSWYILHRFL